MNGKQLLWVLPVFLLTAASQAGENQQFMLKDGDTLVFLGNSITQGITSGRIYLSDRTVYGSKWLLSQNYQCRNQWT